MDLFEFGPKFGLYHYAELPSYKRVKWGRLTGPSLNKEEVSGSEEGKEKNYTVNILYRDSWF